MRTRLWTTIGSAVAISAATLSCGQKADVPDASFDLGTEASAVATTALAPDGAVYWAWFDRDDDETNVYVARLDPDGRQPTDPVKVNRRNGDANMHGQAPAQVAVAPDATVYVAWTNRIAVPGRRFPASDLLFARSTDRGATFSDAVIINDDAGGVPTGHTFHDMAIAADGTIFVSWIDTRALDTARLEGDESGSDHASHDHEHGHHAAGSEDLPGPEIRAAKSTDGGRSFHPSVVVDSDACPCCRTSLALGPDGSVYVGWRKVYDGQIRDMAVAVSTDAGNTFSEPKRVHLDGWKFDGCPHAGPALVVDSSGKLHVAWYTGAEGDSGLFYAVQDGDSFSDPITLSSAANVPVSQVRMTPDGAGSVLLAWEDGVSGGVQLARATEGRLEPILTVPDATQPDLAAGSGIASLTWGGMDGVRAMVFNR